MIFLTFLLPILYAIPFFFVFHGLGMYLQFCLGLILGFLISNLDRFLNTFFIQGENPATPPSNELITHSVLFLLIYVGLAIYVLTSTGSVIGIGLILGIGLHLCIDLWRYQKDEQKFRQEFLWQLKQQLSKQQINYLVIGFSLFFLLLSFLVIRQ